MYFLNRQLVPATTSAIAGFAAQPSFNHRFAFSTQSPEVDPEVTPEVSSGGGATEVTPGSTSESTPEVNPDLTPGLTPAADPLPLNSAQDEVARDNTGGTSEYHITFSPVEVTFKRKEGSEVMPQRLNIAVPHVWLRENCRCSECVNQATMQRNFSVFDLPEGIAPKTITLEPAGMRISWNHENHESLYDWDFLKRNIGRRRQRYPNSNQVHVHWTSKFLGGPPTVQYEEVMDSTSTKGLAKLTDALVRRGVVFVENTPFDDAIHTKHLLERIGPIRETHYGGFYDFVPDMAKADTAYTNIALPAHTDTTYFTDPAGLQAFHMLSHTAPEGSQAEGGMSLLVDGERAAKLLFQEDRAAFKALCSRGVPYHASGNDGVTITPTAMRPVIEALNFNSDNPDIIRIRWNNDDRGTMRIGQSSRHLLEWYQAARKFDEILKRPKSQYWFQLKPGSVLIFDNYRVLHGRSAFTGQRRICGAYINHDDFVSRWRNTNFPRDKVLAQVIG
ncbi:hypothetical protein BD289DRAFT_423336 [Coniella lustricola]|uniref:trimethyllysine dioxygenase n=1 Tax=Coniella lustricola TaxID=2025994 RepID=A0A2T3AJP6_9PEZI|nr:hypothetical protein BD289DRAFT_423336 [Coniella lustricola]